MVNSRVEESKQACAKGESAALKPGLVGDEAQRLWVFCKVGSVVVR